MARVYTTIAVDPATLAAVMEQIKEYPDGIKKVLPRAVNKVAVTARTKITRSVRSEIAITATTANKSVTLRRADRNKPEAKIAIRGKRIPISAFGAKETRRGVTYRISRSGGRKLLPGGFLAKMKSGHEGAMVRRGRTRLPIDERYGPSIPAVVGNIAEFSRDIFADEIRNKLKAELLTQVTVLKSRGGK